MNRLDSEIAQAVLIPTETDGEGWLQCTFRFSANFIGFSGHFPDYPLVPAIVQLLAAQRLAETRLPAGMRLCGVENAKFFQQLRPDQKITVRCRLTPRDQSILAEARLVTDQGMASSFSLKFSPEGSES